MDEVSLGLEPPLHACWMKQGQQKITPALQPGTKKHRHTLGAYSWNTEKISWKVTDWKNSHSFLEFIEYLLVECCPMGRLVLVMDNVSYHKSAAVLAALSLFEHLLLILWLPPYCPELNLIERYWKHLKQLACANKLHDSMKRCSLLLNSCSHSKMILPAIYDYSFLKSCERLLNGHHSIFDPNKHMLKLQKTKKILGDNGMVKWEKTETDYLPVAARTAWFRKDQPLWSIITEVEQLADKAVVMKATIKDMFGTVIATARKKETQI